MMSGFGASRTPGVGGAGDPGVVALRGELERLQGQLAAATEEIERLRSAGAAGVGGGVGDGDDEPELVGRSEALLGALDQADRVAPTDGTVLILGETGTGKELLARRVHARSSRRGRTMTAVNCAALPESLLESALFGHERGAFTGADRRRVGKFELAHRSTLFLDEIGELSLAAQAKLLRVLQDGSFERLGGAETLHADVRLIAATHRDLGDLVRRGRFREDLYYRLNVFAVTMPPLRARTEDVRALAEYLHARHARRMGRAALPIGEAGLRKLLSYRFPGNVRELENIVERATILMREGDGELRIDLPEGSPTSRPGRGEAAGGGDGGGGSGEGRDVLLSLDADQLQRLHMLYALERSGYRVFGEGGAAERLGVHPQTLLSRMDKLGIPRPRKARRGLAGG